MAISGPHSIPRPMMKESQSPKSTWSREHVVLAIALSAIITAALVTAVAINMKLAQAHGLDVWKNQFAPFSLTVPLTALVISSVALAFLVGSTTKKSEQKKEVTTSLDSQLGGYYSGLSRLHPGMHFKQGETLYTSEIFKMEQSCVAQYSGEIVKVLAEDGTVESGTPVVEVRYDQQQQARSGYPGTVNFVAKFEEGAEFAKGEPYAVLQSKFGNEVSLKVDWPITVGTVHVASGDYVELEQELFDFSFKA
jgi:acetyl/propionyl-CoA carboxylase alpha subunit